MQAQQRLQTGSIGLRRTLVSSDPVRVAGTWTTSCQRSWSQQAVLPQLPARRHSMNTRAQAAAADGQASKKTGVLFVCLGNICRSPTAEAVFRSVVERKGLADQFDIDSCGTGGGAARWYQPSGYSYHEGDPADGRMMKAAAARGVKLTSLSRPLNTEDLTRFDYIVAMDLKNRRDILVAANYWAEQDKQLPNVDEVRDKVSLMTSYCQQRSNQGLMEVPDPYYGGSDGFETVLDLLDDACSGLLEQIQVGQVQKQQA